MKNIVDDKQIVFIVGAPRSGTSWLQLCLSLHSEVASLGTVELRVFSEYIPPLRKVWAKEKRRNEENGVKLGLPVIWSDQEFDKFIKEFSDKVYESILNKNKKAKVILDKHPNYSFYIHEILKVYPNAKFIHIYRDGRDAIASIVSAKQRRGFGFDTLNEACNNWVNSVNNCISWQTKIPDQFFQISYEELLKEKKKTLSNIFSYLNLEHSESFVSEIVEKTSWENKKVSEPDPKFQQIRDKGLNVWSEIFSKRELFVISNICDELLLKLKYIENKQEWTGVTMRDKIKFFIFKKKK